MALPRSLQRRCYRCGEHIMYAESPTRALVGGVAVNMHQACKEEHDREQEQEGDNALPQEEAQEAPSS